MTGSQERLDAPSLSLLCGLLGTFDSILSSLVAPLVCFPVALPSLSRDGLGPQLCFPDFVWSLLCPFTTGTESHASFPSCFSSATLQLWLSAHLLGQLTGSSTEQ